MELYWTIEEFIKFFSDLDEHKKAIDLYSDHKVKIVLCSDENKHLINESYINRTA